jgi:hypothetical protein
MINFESTNFDDLSKEALNRAHEISVEIITAICKGMDENAEVISLGLFSNLNLDILIKKADYLNALKTNLNRVAELEEYELCAKAIKCINILESN